MWKYPIQGHYESPKKCMKLQNNLTPGNSPLRSLSTTMKPENSSTLWDTKPLSALLALLPMGKLWALRAAPCLVPALQMHWARPQNKLSSSSSAFLWPGTLAWLWHHWLHDPAHQYITGAVKAALPSGPLRKEEKNSIYCFKYAVFTGEERASPWELELSLLCTTYYLGWWLKNCLHGQVKDWITGF